MRTKDALMIGFQLGRIQRTLDAWEESKHPRADNGQFSSSPGGGGQGTAQPNTPSKEILRKVKNAYMNAEGHDGMDKFHIDWAIKDSHGKISEEKTAETLRIKNGSKESKLAVNTLKAYKDKQITKRDAQNMLAAIIGGEFTSGGGGVESSEPHRTPTKNQVKNATYALSYAMGKNNPGQIANRLMGEGVPEKAIDPIIDEIVKSRKERYDHKGHGSRPHD